MSYLLREGGTDKLIRESSGGLLREAVDVQTVPLGASAGASAATLALSVQTGIPCGTSAATTSAAVVLSAQTVVALGSAAGVSAATLALAGPTQIPLDAAAGASAATLDLTAPSAGPLVTAIGKVQLGSLDTPVAGTQTLRIRARASSGSGVLRTWLYDSDGTTIRGGPTDFTLTGSFQTFSLNPSGITDYSALIVAFQGRNEAGGALTVEVSWIELRVPIATGAAPAVIPLGVSAAVSATTLALKATTRVPLGSAAAVSTTSLTLSVPGAQFLTSAVGTFALLESADHILLESGDSLTQELVGGPLTSAATSTASLTVTTPAPSVLTAPPATATASVPTPVLSTSRTRVVPVAATSASFPTPAAKLILLPSAASANASPAHPTLHGVARRADMPTTLELAPNTTSLEFAGGTTLTLGRVSELSLADLNVNLGLNDRAAVLVLREGNEGALFFLDTALELDEGLGDLELDEGAFELVLNG